MILYKKKHSLFRFINDYEKIIIFDFKCKKASDLLVRFLNYEQLGKNTSKIIILCTDKIKLKSYKRNFCKISRSDLTFILKIYRLYEFSDRITLLSQNPQYPSLLNYILTGVLTEEEFFESLLR